MATSWKAKEHARLASHLRLKMKAHPMTGDTYDGDFIVGVLMEFLEANQLVLCGDGLMRLRRASS